MLTGRSEYNNVTSSAENHRMEVFADQCDQRRLACSVGGESHQGKRQSPVAWVAFVEETKRMKPTDKAILGMVSESPGRNVSEPRSGLDKK